MDEQTFTKANSHSFIHWKSFIFQIDTKDKKRGGPLTGVVSEHENYLHESGPNIKKDHNKKKGRN